MGLQRAEHDQATEQQQHVIRILFLAFLAPHFSEDLQMPVLFCRPALGITDLWY